MIAYLPSDGSWCKQPFPHMTLVWGGNVTTDTLPGDFNQLTKDAISAARLTGPFSLNITGVEELGGGDSGNPAVDALVFYPTPQLLLARNLVQRWNASSFTTFLPHATIGPAGSAAQMAVPQNVWPDVNSDTVNSPFRGLPTSLWFNRIASCWGDQQLIFDIRDI